MKRPLLSLLLLAIALSGCANDASRAAVEPIMRLEIKTRGAIETNNPNVRYYVVLNTATSADNMDLTAEQAESVDYAGVQPPTGQPAGPRVYGPYETDRPLLGYNLPFYLSGGATSSARPEDARRTRSFTGTAPLLPVTWTDYFVLTSESGTLQLIQNKHPNPVTNPRLIHQSVRNMVQGQDWFVDGNSLLILIRLSTLVNGPALSAAPNRIVTANLITSNASGQIIDRWTLSENEPGFILRTAPRSQDQNQKFRPSVLFPLNKPSGVSDDSMNLSVYNSQIR